MVFQHSGARDFDLGGGLHYHVHYSGSFPIVWCFWAHFFDLGEPSHYSGNYLIGFEHCGAHFFDLGGPSHYSGNYLIGFEHCGPNMAD